MDPLLCPRCQTGVKVVACITDPAVIDRILGSRAPHHAPRSRPKDGGGGGGLRAGGPSRTSGGRGGRCRAARSTPGTVARHPAHAAAPGTAPGGRSGAPARPSESDPGRGPVRQGAIQLPMHHDLRPWGQGQVCLRLPGWRRRCPSLGRLLKPAIALTLALFVCLARGGAVVGAPSAPAAAPWAEEDWRPGMATELRVWTVRGFAVLDAQAGEDRLLGEARMIHRAREWLVCDRLADGEPVATRLFYPEWYVIDGLQMDCSLQGQLLPMTRDGATHPTLEGAQEAGSTAGGSQWLESRRQRMSPYGCALARAIALVDSPASDRSIDLGNELGRVLQLDDGTVEVVEPPRILLRSRDGPSSETTIAGVLRVSNPRAAYPELRGEWQSNDGVQFVAGMLTARRQGRLHLSGWLLAQFTGRIDGHLAIAWTLHEVTVAPLQDTLAGGLFGARPRNVPLAPLEPWTQVGSVGGQPGAACFPFVLSPHAVLLPASAVPEGAAVDLVAPGGDVQPLSPRAGQDFPGLRCFASAGAAAGPGLIPSRSGSRSASRMVHCSLPARPAWMEVWLASAGCAAVPGRGRTARCGPGSSTQGLRSNGRQSGVWKT